MLRAQGGPCLGVAARRAIQRDLPHSGAEESASEAASAAGWPVLCAGHQCWAAFGRPWAHRPRSGGSVIRGAVAGRGGRLAVARRPRGGPGCCCWLGRGHAAAAGSSARRARPTHGHCYFCPRGLRAAVCTARGGERSARTAVARFSRVSPLCGRLVRRCRRGPHRPCVRTRVRGGRFRALPLGGVGAARPALRCVVRCCSRPARQVPCPRRGWHSRGNMGSRCSCSSGSGSVMRCYDRRVARAVAGSAGVGGRGHYRRRTRRGCPQRVGGRGYARG